MGVFKRSSFWLGFAAAVGLLLAFTIGGLARNSSSSEVPAASTDAIPSNAPLAAFSTARTSSDVLPASLAAQAADLSGEQADVPAEVQNGRIAIEESRLLLSDLGSTHADLYAFPSEKGGICYLLSTAGGGCGFLTSNLPTADLPVSFDVFDADGPGRGTPTAVAGLAPNNVTSVEVVIAGKSHAATLKNNAYFLEGPSATAQPKTLVVTFASGSTTTVELPKLPTS